MKFTLKNLGEKLNGNYWEKGNLKRVYLDRGYNTNKMSTKTFVWENEEGEFLVSCKIQCPSQPWEWIKSQEDKIKKAVLKDIEEVISDKVYCFVNKEGNIVSSNCEEISLDNLCSNCDFFYSIESAEEVMEDEDYILEDCIIKEFDRKEFEIRISESNEENSESKA